MEALLLIFGAVALIAFIVFYNSLAWGLVTYKFYHWFGMALFPLPDLDYWQCVTLGLFLTIFKSHTTIHLKDEFKDKTSEYSHMILDTWIVLFIGWIFNFIV